MAKNKMTTVEMELILMLHFRFSQQCVVPNVNWGAWIGHECDLVVLSLAGYATEIEIKVSKSDLIKDKEKRHGHYSNWIKYLYFAVPEYLKDAAFEHVPERAGIIICHPLDNGSYTNARVVRIPKRNRAAKKWNEKDRLNLYRLGAMRIYSLKSRIWKLKKQLKDK